VGSDAKACTVWARGAPPVALRFFVRDGKVICDDPVSGRESAVSDGFEKEVGTLSVTVRTGSGAAPAQPPRREKPAPAKVRPAKPVKEAAPLSLDDDDDGFDLPMPPPPPATPQAAKPAPAPPKPPVPTGARPPVPQAKPPALTPAIPPVTPAIKSTAKNPDACPGCGRVIPGKPGARYCMICDQTF
jgi:hypothetical protein